MDVNACVDIDIPTEDIAMPLTAGTGLFTQYQRGCCARLWRELTIGDKAKTPSKLRERRSRRCTGRARHGIAQPIRQ